MQASSAAEVQSSMQEAVQAFREIRYPVTKNQLIEKAKSMNARSEVIQAIEGIPDREYNNAADVLKQFEGIQRAIEALRELKYPSTKSQLIEHAKKHDARSEVIRALEKFPDREYNNTADVLMEFRGKFQSQ
ncbi:DUF2795 domain-containing protein [Methanosarcina acetivorans]|uniref:DUF2795 domain-containing protein n=2 Tax=Methanosarcina acetivorans TaxID=2214 RepID=Q8TNF7_METAC|nr:DUF2795 domain-containing protein [Methanosarcina acetivorans]AAM05721.1 predicted protein [Methanosarcina acetivorans C2A]